MKKNTIISAVSGVALVLGSSALALAASDETNPGSKTVPSAVVEKHTEMNKLNGKEITVAAQLDDRTAIMDGRNSKSFADLKVGERVRMYYVRQDNRELARNILVQPN